jgi:acetoacetyl-CoA synthetase
VIDTCGLDRSGKEPSGRLLLFVVLREAVVLDEALTNRIREQIKTQLSPRYVPDAIFAVPEIPQTLNGKKLEVPVKRIFQGVDVSRSVSREAMSNPDSLKPFLEVAEWYRSQVWE